MLNEDRRSNSGLRSEATSVRSLQLLVQPSVARVLRLAQQVQGSKSGKFRREALVALLKEAPLCDKEVAQAVAPILVGRLADGSHGRKFEKSFSNGHLAALALRRHAPDARHEYAEQIFETALKPLWCAVKRERYLSLKSSEAGLWALILPEVPSDCRFRPLVKALMQETRSSKKQKLSRESCFKAFRALCAENAEFGRVLSSFFEKNQLPLRSSRVLTLLSCCSFEGNSDQTSRLMKRVFDITYRKSNKEHIGVLLQFAERAPLAFAREIIRRIDRVSERLAVALDKDANFSEGFAMLQQRLFPLAMDETHPARNFAIAWIGRGETDREKAMSLLTLIAMEDRTADEKARRAPASLLAERRLQQMVSLKPVLPESD